MTADDQLNSRPLGKCHLCPAKVIWAVTERDKLMPVDAQPSASGNLAIEDRPGDRPLARVVHRDPTAPRDDLHLAHFVTCTGTTRGKGRRPS